MLTDLGVSFYIVAVPAVVLLGFAKAGFYGTGMMAVPLMALVMSPVQAAAIILPVLLVQDVVAMFSFRREWDGWNLRILLPGAVVGIAIGYFFAATFSDAWVSLLVGALAVVFGLSRLLAEVRGNVHKTANTSPLFGLVCGAGSGFTSMIIHAGGPPFQIFVMPQKLPHQIFVGTGVIFFAAVNFAKVLPYVLLGQMSAENLMASLTLVPVAIVATGIAIWLVRRTPGNWFYRLLYLLMVGVGSKLIWDASESLLT